VLWRAGVGDSRGEKGRDFSGVTAVKVLGWGRGNSALRRDP
jgi:hypothetical protein